MTSKRSRYIRVFLSSTFKDMQPERSYIMSKVFPVVKTYAEKFGIILVLVDLRWGIDVGDEDIFHDVKVIDVCLGEIDLAEDFFIGIIGERYGWRPQESELSGISDLVNKYPRLNGYLQQQRSMTDIEFHYGVLDRPVKREASFYKKRSSHRESHRYIFKYKKENDDVLSLQRLEEEIRYGGYYIKEYNDPEDLGKQVEQDLRQLVDLLHNQQVLPVTFFDRERQQQEDSLQSGGFYHGGFLPLEALDAFLNDDIWLKYWPASGQRQELLISGSKGVGKTTLVKEWVKHLAARKDIHVVFHLVGSGMFYGNHTLIARRIYDEVSKFCYLKEPFGSLLTNPIDLLSSMFSQVANKQKILIVLDGIDFLDDQGRGMQWIPKPPKNVYIVYTGRKNSDAVLSLSIRRVQELYIPDGTNDQIYYIVEYLKSHYGKTLSEERVIRITKNIIFRDRHLLNLLLGELALCGLNESLGRYIDYYLHAETPQEFYAKMLKRYEQDYGMFFVRSVLSLLAVTKYGLNENELFVILRIKSRLSWSSFYSSAKGLFTQRDGYFLLNNVEFLSAVSHAYGDTFKEYRRKIVKHFETIDSDRSRLELPWQYYQLNLHDDLFRALLSPPIFMIHYNEAYDNLKRYWDYLLKLDNSRYSLEAYKGQIVTGGGASFYYYCLADFIGNVMLVHSLANEINEMGIPQEGESDIKHLHHILQKAEIAKQTKDFGTALRLSGEVLAKLKAMNNPPQDFLAHTYFVLASCYASLSDYENAISNCKKAVETIGDESQLLTLKASYLDYMGLCCLHNLKVDDARDAFFNGYDILRVANPLSRQMASCCFHISYFLSVGGRRDDSKVYFDQALRIIEEMRSYEKEIALFKYAEGTLAKALKCDHEAEILLKDVLKCDNIPEDVRQEVNKVLGTGS